MKIAVRFLLLIACSTGAAAAVNDKMLVSTGWMAAHLRDRNVTVVHVGATRDAYQAGHIPGAVFLALTDLATERGGVPNELPPLDKLTKTLDTLGIGNRGRIIVVGDEPVLAARLFYTLDYLGHGHRVAMLDGGFAQWKRENRELETAARTVNAEPFTAHIHLEQLVFLSQLKKIIPSDSLALVDARPHDEFAPGHIPGAMNIFWLDNVDADGKLLSVDELQKKHASVDRAKPVVTYCNSGMQSSFEYFVLRYLGYNVAMYDGSFIEWTNDPEARQK